MSGDPGAEDAQAAVELVMGRLVQLEEALNRVLDDEPDARDTRAERWCRVAGGDRRSDTPLRRNATRVQTAQAK